MEIQHPNSAPLSPEEQQLLTTVRERFDARMATGGLSSDDVRHLQDFLRGHPHASTAVITAIAEEAERRFPGQRLINVDWS
jgi:hypothetical protein